MKTTTYSSRYFYGHEISKHGLECGYLDYYTLSRAFDAILVNDITKLFYSTLNGQFIEPEQINGFIDNTDEIDAKREQIETLEYTRDNSDDEEQVAYIEEQIAAIEEQIEELEREQENEPEIYQYYIVTDRGANIIQEFTNDPVFYIEYLDLYIWGVCHWGTGWDYVLTDCKIELEG